MDRGWHMAERQGKERGKTGNGKNEKIKTEKKGRVQRDGQESEEER